MLRAILVAAIIAMIATALWPSPPAKNAPTVAVAAPAAPKVAAAAPKPTIDKSAEAQRKRKDLIQKLVNERVFIKVDTPGTLPRVYVGRRFMGLDYDTKQSFVSVVYAYHFDGSDQFAAVRVFDGLTNKSIGTFTTMTGLKLD